MKKMMLCFDVDGTLRDNVKHEVSASTRETLIRLKNQGYVMVISSGRGVDSLEKTGVMDIIDWDGFVCNNGQVILNKQRKEIFHSSLKEEAIIQTLQIADELGYAVVLKSHPRVITKEPDAYVLESQRFFNNVIPQKGTYHGQSVDAMIVYGPKGYDYAPFKKVKGITVLPGESTYADLTVEGLSKATGIQLLMDMYECDQYIAFGDSLNDMDMFKHAYLSVAMGQGNETLKKHASYVTTTIDNHGIYHACVYLGLLKEESNNDKR